MRRSLLAVALFCLALDVAALEPPAPNEKWITLTVDELQFISNAPPAKTMNVARNMLRMRAAVGQGTNLKIHSTLPTKVFLFARPREFAAYRDALLQRTAKNVGGMFAHGDTGSFILIPAGGVDQVVYHELTHSFVQNTRAGLPLWFTEGIAEYYSTFRIEGNSMQIGRPVTAHVMWLRNEKMIPLEELFATTKEAVVYNENERIGVFYAQSWALVHYLLTEPERRARLGRFLAELDGLAKVDEAFRKAFAMTYEQLEEELRAYVRRSTFSYLTVPLDETLAADLPKPEPMTRRDVMFELGHLLAQAGGATTPAAERFLKEVLALDPNHAGAHADLGLLYETRGRRAEADAEYATALKLGSDDVNVVMQTALLLAERHSRSWTAPVPRAEVLKVRELFERVTKLDPTRAAAWTGFGKTYLDQNEDVGPGIAALEKSLELAPGDDPTAILLAMLYIKAKRADAVAKLSKRLLESPTVDLVSKTYLRSLVEDFDREAVHEKIVESMNAAMAKADAGQYGEALAIIDGVLPSILDPETRAQAQKYREEVAARAKKR